MGAIGEGCGLLVRVDPRGLGVQTAVLHKFIQPERTLVIVMGPGKTPYDQLVSLYGSGENVMLSSDQVNVPMFFKWAHGLKSVLSCEAFYNDEIPEMARSVGIKTVLQFNYEFLRYMNTPSLPRPDIFLAPSMWNVDRIPFKTRYLPPPVDRERLPFEKRTQAKRFLHVAGHPAMHDRAGTITLFQAIPHIQSEIEIVVKSQQRLDYMSQKDYMEGNVHVRIEEGNVGTILDYVKLYEGFDALIAPRRYGGMSLPLNEASSLGMPILALDREPERSILHPASLVKCHTRTTFQGVSDVIDVAGYAPEDLAYMIDSLAQSPRLVQELSLHSDAYAQTLDWSNLEAQYQEVLH